MGDSPSRVLTPWMKLALSAAALCMLAAGIWFSRVEGAAVRRQAQQAFQAVATIKVAQIAARYLYPLVQTWPTPSSTAETLLVRRHKDSALFLNALRHRAPAALQVHATAFYAMLLALMGGAVAVGLVAWQRDRKAHYRALYHAEATLRASVERHSVMLKSVGDAIVATDVNGCVELLNPVAEALTGWRPDEALGRPLAEIFKIINEETRKPVENPVARVLREGLIVGLANHTVLVDRGGTERPIADSAAPIRDDHGRTTGAVMVFRDQTDERRMHTLIQTRLDLLNYASTHDVTEVLTRALDEMVRLLDSPVGFYDVIEPDFDTPVLSQCHPQTPSASGTADDQRSLVRIGDLQAWARSVRATEPVIDNGSALPPEVGSAPSALSSIARRLMVPVVREGRVVALLALGDKPGPYTGQDVEAAAYLADVTWHVVEAKRAAERRRESDLRFRAIYDCVDVGIAELSFDRRIRHANPAYCRRLGYTEDELVGMHLREITHPESVVANLRQQERLISGDIDGYVMEKRFVCKDGSTFCGWLQATLIRDATGRPAYTLGAVVDVTERKRAGEERDKLQAQLVMASKMESIGRLAGGIAHDFNNMLLVILGSAERELARTDLDAPQREALSEIQKAALRSSDLTRQLVAFARSQIIAPKVLDLDQTVEGTLKMIRRLIGEDIDLVWRPRSGDWRVKVDPTQIDQILANLCVNARDAIDGVGKIVIETDRATLDMAYCDGHPGSVPGEFVMLAVSDDGCGMDKETQLRVFEPFFTTKSTGHGTGLGLSTVYGIVKQSDGFINVYSEPGAGTTFKIYLPRCRDEMTDRGAAPVTETPRGQGETILLVEDEASILRLVTTMLRDLGYTVLAAGAVRDAIELCEAHRDEIQLLITDVVMADMNGRELADHLAVIAPNLKCLFMSGYTAAVIAHRGVLDPGVDFIQKPFSMEGLANKVRATLQKA